MSRIRVAIAGIGNCASNLIQGIEYYKKSKNRVGLMNASLGGYDVTDIDIVAAFDISKEKVGKDISDAIFATPNCTPKVSDVPFKGIEVKKGPVLDGWNDIFEYKFHISEANTVDIGEALLSSRAEILLIMLPTGSREAAYVYAKAALENGVSVINGIPVLLSRNDEIVAIANKKRVCIVGDDFKSQIGGTILHNSLLQLLQLRGIKVNSTYQLNYGGNMDFYNLQTDRGKEKHESKERGIMSGYDSELNCSINVSYLENLGDNKTCRIRVEGVNFSECPVTIDCTMTVVDSANASGVIIDAIRCIKAAQERGIYGYLAAPSAFYMKSPVEQMSNEKAIEGIKRLTYGNEYNGCK